ncbi:MAG: carboxypeptidase regulatory-like domain-containing protein, partial [Polyangia bacterium]
AVALPARADNPILHVRARLRIDLDAIERAPGGLVVRGSLRDDATDEPIVGRVLAISVEGPNGFFHYAEASGPDGGFRWRVPLPLGSYRLRLGAGGDADYLAPTPIDRNIDVGRRTTTVTVQVPARIAAHAPSLHVVVEAHESDGIGPPRAYDGYAWLTIGGRGRSTLSLQNGRAESDELGPFGRAGTRVEVRAAIEESGDRNGASGSKSVLLTTPTSITLAVGADRVAPDKLLLVTGTLHDDDGPIAGAFVVIGLENGADVTSFATDGDGRYSGWLRGRDLPTGPAFLEARFRPREDWRDAAVSATVPVEVLPAPPIAVWPYVLSPALTLVAAAVVFAARDRRWRRWLRVGRRARRIAAGSAAVTAPGLTESRRGILASLRRADHGMSGVVVDAADDRPIPTATLVARTADGESRAATVDERGRFAFEDLAPGELVVEAAAPGYVGERFSRALPHRGELRNARVRLVPVRARIFDAWRRAAAPLYPTPRAAETMTPRELLRHLERKRLVPHERLAALTALVEAAVWGAHAPSSEELAEAERLATALKADS